MNTMEWNKIAAAILLAGVIAMSFGFLARLVVPNHSATASHGGDHHGPNLFADLVPTEAPPPGAEPAGPEPILALMASADASAGESNAQRRCASCHSFEQGGPNKVGPNLYNTVGTTKAHADDYAYSDALASMEGAWGYEELNQFLYDPKGYVPGTKMNFAGLSRASDRADIIAYLREQTSNPPPLPEPEAEPSPEAEASPEAESPPSPE